MAEGFDDMPGLPKPLGSPGIGKSASWTTVQNDIAYSRTAGDRIVTLTLEVKLDAVPGWGHQIEDHIQHIFQNPYVLSASHGQPLKRGS